MRPRYVRADRRPTWTSLALEALRRADDFLTREALRAATGASPDQLAAALHHLRKRAGAVDVLEQDGTPYYFLTGEDRRGKTVDERVQEPKGNRCRRARATA